ncbi:MAG: hypothetical protein AAF191_08210 [Verrucomicrobiota bacterium]
MESAPTPPRIQLLVDRLIDRSLTRRERSELQRHLATSPEVRGYVAQRLAEKTLEITDNPRWEEELVA